MPSDPQRPVERGDLQVARSAGAAGIAYAGCDHTHSERPLAPVADDDDEPLPLAGIQAGHVSGELEAGRCAAVACSKRAERRRRREEGCGDRDRDNRAGTRPHTTTVALFGLSGPRQFVPAAGVTVYCHEPDGTPVSTQVSTVSVPEQPLVAPMPTPVVTL